MNKSTSLMLGIMASGSWIAMIVLLLVTNAGLQALIHDIEPTPGGFGAMIILFLFGWLFWGLALLFVIIYAIGIPHFFLYIYNKHRTTYMYLVKYLSVIPLSLLVVYGFFNGIIYYGSNLHFLTWFRFGWPIFLIIPLTIIVLLTRRIPYKKRG